MIALACRNLSGVVGGVERMLTNLANNLAQNGYDVLIITWDVLDAPSFYKLDNRIKWEKVGIGNLQNKISYTQKFKRIKMLRNILVKYKLTHCLCFQLGTYNSIVISSLFTSTKVIALERNSLQRFSYTNSESFFINYFFMLFANRIVVQFHSYINDYPKFLSKKIISIPNFHNLQIKKKIIRKSKFNKVVFVGRFSYQKNIIFTLNTFIECCKIDNSLNFEFIGKGGKKSEMERIIVNSGFSKRIKIIEPKSNWYLDKEIDVLCLFSLWEGFPNVILEAFSNSILCIGANDTKGIKDLLSCGRGVLVNKNNVKNVAKEILKLINLDLKTKNDISTKAINYSKIHKPSDIIPSWKLLLK